MEDASGVDLDWFWRGWFYTTDHVDIAMDEVKWYQIDTQDPAVEAAFEREQDNAEPADISLMRDVDFIPRTYIEEDVSLNDFYTTTDPYMVLELDKVEYTEAMERLSDEERAMLASGKNFYEITFRNEGGLVMPLIVQFEYEDGREEIRRIPAEIWKMSEPTVTKVFVTDAPVTQITLDPMLETADVDMSDNYWPARPQPTRFELFKSEGRSRWGASSQENPMQRARRDAEMQSEDADGAGDSESAPEKD
ncbi:MAG: hypothetical protein L7S62_07385, partial [Flavobacteriales bacterium]|nr:hypothetical protein [Flavobacteriales bacterium]